MLVENDASISTGSAGSAVFVIGRDAFLIRGNNKLELNPTLDSKQNEISGFSLRSGAILSVFAGNKRTLRTVTAVIESRELESILWMIMIKLACVPVNGLPILQVKDVLEIIESVTTSHHDQPRFIYYGEKRIEQVPVINHSDQKLILFENLVSVFLLS